jgi:hypothetical protein
MEIDDAIEQDACQTCGSSPSGRATLRVVPTFFFGLLWFLREIFLATASLRFRTK